jgi:hypothetical protein
MTMTVTKKKKSTEIPRRGPNSSMDMRVHQPMVISFRSQHKTNRVREAPIPSRVDNSLNESRAPTLHRTASELLRHCGVVGNRA